MQPLETPTIEDVGGTVCWLTADDGGLIRYAEFSPVGSPVGSVLFLPGFTEFIEKHLESVGALVERGYSVLILDWRGLGLSSRALPCAAKGHIETFDLYLDDLRAVVEQSGFNGRRGRKILLGHSMGGHLALRHLHDHPGHFDQTVLCAPMADILTGKIPRKLAPLIGSVFNILGLGNIFVFGADRSLEQIRRFEGNPLTSDEARFDRTYNFSDRDPRLLISGPTFHWVWQALKSIDMVNQDAYLAEIAGPVLILGAEKELIVDNRAQQRWADKIPGAVRIELAAAYHELMNEKDEIYREFWLEFDKFTSSSPAKT